jgi:hypothetical protein
LNQPGKVEGGGGTGRHQTGRDQGGRQGFEQHGYAFL